MSVDQALAECLGKLESGELSPEEALRLYPALRSELEPLLGLASELRSLPAVAAPARLRGYKRPLFRPVPVRESWWRRLFPAGGRSLGWAAPLAQMAAVVAILLVAGGSAVVASASSLPDEPLYPVKLAVESAQLALAPTDDARADLELKFASRRLAEVESAAQQGRADAVAKGADLYLEKVDAALKASGSASVSTESEVQDTVRQNQVALEKVLAKVENPTAQAAVSAAIQRTAASGETPREKPSDKDARPNERAATAVAGSARATAAATSTATPVATPAPTLAPAAPADTHEPPGQSKGRTPGPAINPGLGNPAGQEPRGQGQAARSEAAAREDVSSSPTQVPTETLVQPSVGQGADVSKGNASQKPRTDSEPSDSADNGQKKGNDKKDFLNNFFDGIQKLVSRR